MRISDWSSDVCSSDLIILRDAGQAKEALPGILAEARSEGVDLILSWGTSVTLGIGGTLSQLDDPTRNHEIPEIFMIVADPVGAGIVESLEHTGRPNLTGTYNRETGRASRRERVYNAV